MAVYEWQCCVFDYWADDPGVERKCVKDIVEKFENEGAMEETPTSA